MSQNVSRKHKSAQAKSAKALGKELAHLAQLKKAARPAFVGPRLNKGARRGRAQKAFRANNGGTNGPGMGTVVTTRLTKVGMSDVKRHKAAWVLGYTYVGDGTNGTNNKVYFLDAAKTHLLSGHSLTAVVSSGVTPVSFRDALLGYIPLVDIAKHFSRYIIQKATVCVESLQPSTSNNMMAIIAPTRGPGLAAENNFVAFATAAVNANSVADLSSMNGAVTVDSWQTKRFDCTHYIAGGSGAKQNEFEVVQFESEEEDLQAGSLFLGVGDIPFGLAIAGNSTTAGLEGTVVHQIVVELELDFLDYVGGMSQMLSGNGIELSHARMRKLIQPVSNIGPPRRERRDLRLQVNELGRMMKALLVNIPDDSKEIEIVEPVIRNIPIVGREASLPPVVTSRTATPQSTARPGWFAQ
jgi:hypothetical protein